MVGPLTRAEQRMTVPRGGGQKKALYELRVWIHAAVKDEFQGGDDFDTALEILMNAFRTANVPVAVSDPQTGASAGLFQIGEEMHLTQEQPGHMANGPAGLAHFFAELLISAEELLPGV